MGEHGGIYETSKFNINMRKFLFIFCSIILFSSCIKKNEKEYLTKKEILEDCKILENYLKTSYILYAENLKINPELINLKDDIVNSVFTQNKKEITIEDFQKAITAELVKKITIPDSHLTVFSSNKINQIFSSKKLYYSDILFIEKNGKYYVYDSSDDNIRIGDEFTGNVDNLFMTIKNDICCYQYGVMSNKMIKSCLISVNGNSYQIRVYNTKNNNEQNNYDEKKSVIIPNIDFAINNNEAAKAFNIPSDMSNYNLIIDLRNNNGGIIDNCIIYLNELLFNGNELEKLNLLNKIQTQTQKTLLSGNVLQANYKLAKERHVSKAILFRIKISEIFFKLFNIKNISDETKNTVNNDIKLDYSNFPKKIIVLINNQTSSAAELFLADLYTIGKERVVTIGENTAGCISLIGNYKYILKNSKIGICLSNIDERSISQLQNPKFKGELKGFFPDYWTINGDISDYIKFVFKE